MFISKIRYWLKPVDLSVWTTTKASIADVSGTHTYNFNGFKPRPKIGFGLDLVLNCII